MLKQKFGMSDEQVEMIAEQVRVENQEKEEKAQPEKIKIKLINNLDGEKGTKEKSNLITKI